MAQSTTTLLQVVNECLRNIGERTVNGMTGVVALKARDAINYALQDIAALNDWNWMTETSPAYGWNLDTATLPDVHKLYGVQYGTTSLTAVSRTEYPWFASVAGTPQIFHFKSPSEVLVHPYPATLDEQSKVLFHYNKPLQLPSVETNALPIPERFISLLVKGACSYLALNHLDDSQAARMHNQMFQMQAQQLVVRETGTPSGSRNFYRRR